MAYRAPYSDEERDGSSSSSTGASRRARFINTELLIPVPLDFLEDSFNYTDLAALVSNFDGALRYLLYTYSGEDPDACGDEVLQQEAGLLYGLLHARYVTTEPGLARLKKLVLARRFGSCPREGCRSCPLIPVGVSDTPGVAPVSGYCLGCRDVYAPLPVASLGAEDVDGAFYGASLPHLLCLQFPGFEQSVLKDLRGPGSPGTDDPESIQSYPEIGRRKKEARLYGFRIRWPTD